MIMGLESSGTQLTGQVIKAKLLQDVQIEENSSKDTAFFTNNNNKYKSNYRNNHNNSYKPNNYYNNRKRYTNKDNKYKNQKCYTCNKYGHISSICRSNPNNKNKTEHGNLCLEEDDIEENCWTAFSFTTCLNDIEKDNWYLDSGATVHMSPHKHLIKNFRQSSKGIKIANKEIIQTEGQGDIEIKVKLKNERYVKLN
uniref:CCHC-type domain-containing protein n=1 Tax=Clastoptera arizonana TaxID=38151 RepID=A0A1B6CTS6_9HEMI